LAAQLRSACICARNARTSLRAIRHAQILDDVPGVVEEGREDLGTKSRPPSRSSSSSLPKSTEASATGPLSRISFGQPENSRRVATAGDLSVVRRFGRLRLGCGASQRPTRSQ
jgi:hypothetical protein